MIISIDVAAADDSGAHPWLDRILDTVEDGWHVWNVIGLEEFEHTSWATEEGRAGARVRELLEASVKRGGWPGDEPHGRRVRVRLAPVAGDELKPEAAARLAEQPMTVLVENRNSDGAFIDRIVELDSALKRWWRREPTPVRIDSLGGKGEMKNEVERLGGRSPRPRLVVVVDSDRRSPEDQPSSEAQRVRTRCERHGFPCWVLERREAENYLLLGLLEERPNAGDEHRRRLDAWDRLSDEQKDHFDMKNGLPEKPKPPEARLFEPLDNGQRAVLEAGFGPNVWECWRVEHIRLESVLNERDREELSRGLELIKKEV